MTDVATEGGLDRRVRLAAAACSIGAALCFAGGVAFFLGTLLNIHAPDVAGTALVPAGSSAGGRSLPLGIVPMFIYWPGALLLMTGAVLSFVRPSERSFATGICLAAAIWSASCCSGLLLAHPGFTLSFPLGNMEMNRPKPMVGIWVSFAGSLVALVGSAAMVGFRARAVEDVRSALEPDPAASMTWSRVRSGALLAVLGGATYCLGVCLYHHGQRYLPGSIEPAGFYLTFVSWTSALTYLPGAALLLSGGFYMLVRRSMFRMIAGVCFAAGFWTLCMSASAFIYRWINTYGPIGESVWRGWGWWGDPLWSGDRITGMLLALAGSIAGLAAAVSIRWALAGRRLRAAPLGAIVSSPGSILM